MIHLNLDALSSRYRGAEVRAASSHECSLESVRANYYRNCFPGYQITDNQSLRYCHFALQLIVARPIDIHTVSTHLKPHHFMTISLGAAWYPFRKLHHFITISLGAAWYPFKTMDGESPCPQIASALVYLVFGSYKHKHDDLLCQSINGSRAYGTTVSLTY